MCCVASSCALNAGVPGSGAQRGPGWHRGWAAAPGAGQEHSPEGFYGRCWRRDKIAIHSERFPRIKGQEENISVLVWE